jgi:hypothetical protein
MGVYVTFVSSLREAWQYSGRILSRRSVFEAYAPDFSETTRPPFDTPAESMTSPLSHREEAQ